MGSFGILPARGPFGRKRTASPRKFSAGSAGAGRLKRPKAGRPSEPVKAAGASGIFPFPDGAHPDSVLWNYLFEILKY